MAAVPQPNRAGAVDAVLTGAADIAVMPQVVYKIVEMSTNDDSSAQDLERAIVVDPGFSAKVLAQANSAQFSLPKRVTSIKEAVMFLGFKQVRALAMAVGVFDFFVGKTDKESLRRRAWWRHSLDTAVVARSLAVFTKGAHPDTAYTCGLLHMLGKTLLCRFAAAEYDKVEFLTGRGVQAWQAEEAVFGCHHVDIIEEAGARWRFPELILGGLNYVAVPAPDDENAGLRAIVALSHRIAELAKEEQLPGEDESLHLPEWALATLGLNSAGARVLVASALADVATQSSLGGLG